MPEVRTPGEIFGFGAAVHGDTAVVTGNFFTAYMFQRGSGITLYWAEHAD